MKIINFTTGQGSQEWHEWRSGGIGASDIGVIMGTSPYMTPRELWHLKCGLKEEKAPNAAMRYGSETEHKAREWLNDNLGLHLSPLCMEDEEKAIFKASLDGFDTVANTIIEIKCPFSEKTIEAFATTSAIPAHWYDQLQWQLMISGAKHAYIAVWDYRKSLCYKVEVVADLKRIKEMREKALEFWEHVRGGVAPAPGEDDYIEIEDEGLKVLLQEYDELKTKEKAISARLKELKSQIVGFGDDDNFTAYGFKVKRHAPPSSYDYKKMELDGIDLESYKKKSSGIGFYKIYTPKGAK